ncbi:hypothetical protein H6P81_000682 [Aristolochia fimbriata]|uniref:Neurochondrin n=1 Tax=Aristolochia fimbriata TaxID=158543 RepID=A0AAV7F6E9_ARIFI|nr:hypothetical protein H6P81_000682 [Aristolochia fimbriata]
MEPSPALEECLKLLKGERDEQRLAGLLLVTKVCQNDDEAAILKVYEAVGVGFLERLLKTGMGKGSVSKKEGDNREAYLRLGVTVLASFCRVTGIASSQDIISMVPLVLEAMSNRSGSSTFVEFYEFMLLVAAASEDGLTTFYKFGGLKSLAFQVSSFPDGSPMFEHTLRLMQLILSKIPLDVINTQSPSELAMMVVAVARQFAVLHNALKFDALHVLSLLLSSNHAAPLHGALRSISSEDWATYIRFGIVTILQNRVVATEKLQALILAESMMSMLGESWLLEPTKLPHDQQDPIPVDRCLFLVLESSRVEVAVLLNELAYLKFEASTSTECIPMKKQNLAISFSLIEKIIRLISNVHEAKDKLISDNTGMKVISGLNETVGVVLDFLKDAKDHGQKRGDDLLASVRIVGSYLAEAPSACKHKVRELLDYMLSVEGEDEESPFSSVCFLLPMLCQTTMKLEGCKALTSFGGHKAVVECLARLIHQNNQKVEDSGLIFLACDTIMNLLLKREELRAQLAGSEFVPLLPALAAWAEDSNETSVVMMATSICSLIFELTSEETLFNYPNFNPSILNCLSRLIAKSLAYCSQGELSYDSATDHDLHQIVASGFVQWADRFPHIKRAVESHLQQ